MTSAKLRLVMAAMGQPETKVGDLCRELGVTRQTLYRHVDPDGNLREYGKKLLAGKVRLGLSDFPVPLLPNPQLPLF